MARCMVCRKSLLRCNCHNGSDSTPTSRRRQENTTTAKGVTWCGRCNCRVMNGKCTNARCSSHS